MKLELAKIILSAPDGADIRLKSLLSVVSGSPIMAVCSIETCCGNSLTKKFYSSCGVMLRIEHKFIGSSGNYQYHSPKEGTPAVEGFYEDGALYYQEWWQKGNLHRPAVSGPALVEYSAEGKLKYYEYWEDGLNLLDWKRM